MEENILKLWLQHFKDKIVQFILISVCEIFKDDADYVFLGLKSFLPAETLPLNKFSLRGVISFW